MKFIRFTGEKNNNGHKLAEFLCSCGEPHVAAHSRVMNGYIKHCTACRNRRGPVKHGLRHTDEYRIWIGIKNRCFNPESKDYERYGGRGITMCKEWVNNPHAFITYMGRRLSNNHSVDRIDNEKGYEPGHVRWATSKEQQRNRRGCVKVTDGKAVSFLVDVAKEMGLSKGTAYLRLKRGKLTGYRRVL
jgi:hypothetical protein